MRKLIIVNIYILAAMICSLSVFAGDEGLVCWWKFDKAADEVLDSISGLEDEVEGNFCFAEGVSGKCIRFDGYTTRVVRKAGNVPILSEAFTIEAWVAPQVYPWNWTAIVNQSSEKVEDTEKSEQVIGQLKPGLFGLIYGSKELKRPEKTIEFTKTRQDWTGYANDWSARLKGFIEAPVTGDVVFSAEADNGLKLEIGGQMVINGWGPSKNRSGRISMVKGKKYPVVLLYFQDGGKSILDLYWSWAGKSKTVVNSSALWHSEKEEEEFAKALLESEGEPIELEDRIFFGIDAEGHLGMKVRIGGEYRQCVSIARLGLLKWSHIAASFDKDKGISLFIDGKDAGFVRVKGVVTPEQGYNLLIGKSVVDMSPVGTEREASSKTMSRMVFDGLIDEVKIYNRALSAQQVEESFAAVTPSSLQPLSRRVMPCGPKDMPSRFGAVYCRLRYNELWEKSWRVGEFSDVLVTFDESPVRVVFWRGTSYGASWITENGIWMGDQSLEDSGTGWGLSEHMADKQCRYSHVRILENHDARVFVHWRYAVSDIRYTINHPNPETGWGDWTDEYFYIYPDSVGVRKQVLFADGPGGFQWQETIVFNQPGTKPEDNIEYEAFTLANMQGQSRTYSWADGSPDEFEGPPKANIQLTNLKSEYKPFIIFKPTSKIKAFGSGHKLSKFPWWNHWPAAMIPSDGRRAAAADRPSHSSLSYRKPAYKENPDGSSVAVNLYGMTNETVTSLVPLAKSWNYPATVDILTKGFESEGYDMGQRAFVLNCKDSNKASVLTFALSASERTPVVNPAFVIKNWGTAGAKLKIDSKEVKQSRDFRFGFNRTLKGTDLIVWINLDSVKPIKITLSPVGN